MAVKKRGHQYRELARRKSFKRFFTTQFRNKYLLKPLENESELVRNTNRILINNRTILNKLLLIKRKTVDISKDRLEELGFCFDYFTSVTIDKRNIIYHCYEIKYFSKEEGMYTIPKQSQSHNSLLSQKK